MECNLVNDKLEHENKKLKEEVTELRQIVKDLVENFNFKSSRQNHSCITDEKPSHYKPRSIFNSYRRVMFQTLNQTFHVLVASIKCRIVCLIANVGLSSEEE